jgi:hypothetical protein
MLLPTNNVELPGAAAKHVAVITYDPYDGGKRWNVFQLIGKYGVLI